MGDVVVHTRARSSCTAGHTAHTLWKMCIDLTNLSNLKQVQHVHAKIVAAAQQLVDELRGCRQPERWRAACVTVRQHGIAAQSSTRSSSTSVPHTALVRQGREVSTNVLHVQNTWSIVVHLLCGTGKLKRAVKPAIKRLIGAAVDDQAVADTVAGTLEHSTPTQVLHELAGMDNRHDVWPQHVPMHARTSFVDYCVEELNPASNRLVGESGDEFARRAAALALVSVDSLVPHAKRLGASLLPSEPQPKRLTLAGPSRLPTSPTPSPPQTPPEAPHPEAPEAPLQERAQSQMHAVLSYLADMLEHGGDDPPDPVEAANKARQLLDFMVTTSQKLAEAESTNRMHQQEAQARAQVVPDTCMIAIYTRAC